MSNDRDDDESSSYIGSWTLKPGRFLDDLLSNSGSALWNPMKLCASEIDTSSRYASDPGLLFNARGGDGGSIRSSFWTISTNSDILSLVSAISHKETCKVSLQQPYFLWNWQIIRSARNNTSYCTTLYRATTGAIEKNARVIIHVSEPDRPPGAARRHWRRLDDTAAKGKELFIAYRWGNLDWQLREGLKIIWYYL
jgi:hypothetical protein